MTNSDFIIYSKNGNFDKEYFDDATWVIFFSNHTTDEYGSGFLSYIVHKKHLKRHLSKFKNRPIILIKPSVELVKKKGDARNVKLWTPAYLSSLIYLFFIYFQSGASYSIRSAVDVLFEEVVNSNRSKLENQFMLMK